MSQAKREYSREIQTFLRKRVSCTMENNKVWSGFLLAIAVETSGFVVLGKATLHDEEKSIIQSVHKVFININEVSQIVIEEAPFDLVGLTSELEKVFRQPGHVKFYEESGLIVVLDRVRVTEKGVEGAGPVADRVRAIYERFKTDIEKEKTDTDE
ncbi:MAG: Lsm family RNA-binding protein [Candidatus Hodarchaeales archaeon]|jgi:hypothetical protein